MKYTPILYLPLLVGFIFMLAIGCETQNPVCSENYCVMGEIFPRSEIGERAFEELPASVDEETLVGLLAGKAQGAAAIAGTPLVQSTPRLNFVSAHPASGSEILPNTLITLTFDNAPTNVVVSPGNAARSGKTLVVYGPFTPGPLNLNATWAGGWTRLTYIVAADSDPPRVTGGTVKNGDFHVNAEVINSAGKIEVTFSEQVRGHIALQTIGGEDVGWRGRVEGNKGVLELLRGKEIDNGTLYVIISIVRDAVGNEAEIKTLFQTKGVKRSVVEETVVEEPTVSFKDDILPILKAHCQICHRRSVRHDPKGGLDLTSHRKLMEGRVLDPGWSITSPIVFRISVDSHDRMPLHRDPLSTEQIQLIIDWIDQGAKDN